MSSERHCLKVRVTEKIREFLRASLDEKEIKTKLEEKILQELEQSLETYSEGEITEGQSKEVDELYSVRLLKELIILLQNQQSDCLFVNL